MVKDYKRLLQALEILRFLAFVCLKATKLVPYIQSMKALTPFKRKWRKNFLLNVGKTATLEFKFAVFVLRGWGIADKISGTAPHVFLDSRWPISCPLSKGRREAPVKREAIGGVLFSVNPVNRR